MSESKTRAGFALGAVRASPEAIEALAEAWASVDGKLDYFHRERGMGMPPVGDWRRLDWRGHYIGYMEEAGEMIRRLEKRGFTLAALSSLSGGGE